MLLGNQIPQVRTYPEYVSTHGEDVSFVADAYGMSLDPWQRMVVDDWHGCREDGHWAAMRCGLSVPRQNGKNGALEVTELYRMTVLGRKMLHTAHEVKTARKAFLRLVAYFENEEQYPELAEMVVEIRRTNGQEAVILNNGGSCEFSARSKGAARGFTVDDLVLDEAQQLSDEQLESLLFTIAAAPSGNPQIIMLGTPPGPNNTADVWLRNRKQGVSGTSEELSWIEFSLQLTDGRHIDVTDRQNWAATNPGLGRRIFERTILNELDMSDVAGFARERLGMYADQLQLTVFGAGVWEAGKDAESQIVTRPKYSVDVAADRSSATISAAGRRDDGKLHGEVVAAGSGMSWVKGWFRARTDHIEAADVWIDSGSPAGGLVPDLEEVFGEEPHTISTREYGQACGFIVGLVKDGEFVHIDQPELNTAVRIAEQVPMGDLFRWSRRTTAGNVTPLISVTVAVWAAADPTDDDESVYNEERGLVSI